MLSQSDWYIVNIQQFGYFRVNYEAQNWQALINQLNTDHKVRASKVLLYFLFLEKQSFCPELCRFCVACLVFVCLYFSFFLPRNVYDTRVCI